MTNFAPSCRQRGDSQRQAFITVDGSWSIFDGQSRFPQLPLTMNHPPAGNTDLTLGVTHLQASCGSAFALLPNGQPCIGGSEAAVSLAEAESVPLRTVWRANLSTYRVVDCNRPQAVMGSLGVGTLFALRRPTDLST